MENLTGLVRSAQQGDKNAFGRIVVRFQDMAFGIAYAMLGEVRVAQDAAQEAFLDAYLSVRKLREPAAFPAWFRRVVVKHSDRQVRSARLSLVPLEAASKLPASGDGPELVVQNHQTSQALYDAITALPGNQKLATILFYIQGYSQAEIAEILELSQGAVKKSLYSARQKLKQRMIAMLQDDLNVHKPSRNDHFANKVAYFIALKNGDLPKIRQLVSSDSELLSVQTEWGVASEGWYWPIGATALHWAASTGDLELLDYLLSQDVDVDLKTKGGRTPLHVAVVMRRVDVISRLFKHGADVNAPTPAGLTPLHLAVIRDYSEIAAILLANGADLRLTDQEGRSALDWARLKKRDRILALFRDNGEHLPGERPATGAVHPSREAGMPVISPMGDLLGRVLDKDGVPLDGGPACLLPGLQPAAPAIPEEESTMLETGVKVIDLFAPLKRGGLNGVFTPLPGVGKFVILDQLIDSLITNRNGLAVCVGLESGFYTGENMMLVWRDWGVHERIVNVFGKSDAPEADYLALVQTGLAIAENFRLSGKEVLMLVDSQVALQGVAWDHLKAVIHPRSGANVTAVFYGGHTLGAEPLPLDRLDAAITFDIRRARLQLWPAIDPLRSRSSLFAGGSLSMEHQQIAARCRALLTRYADLLPLLEDQSDTALPEAGDSLVALRAPRLDKFLTQPLPGAEPWTGTPGYLVDLQHTLHTCRVILDGDYDQVDEADLYFRGAIDSSGRGTLSS